MRSLSTFAICVLLGMRAVSAQDAPERLDRQRFTFVFFPHDRQLAASLAASAVERDTFPGLARPRQRVVIAIAPDRRRFREWVGSAAPEWGSAVAFPDSRRIVIQGQRAGAEAGDPRIVLRHELAHLALHEYLGDLPPRWFDEGYASVAAGESQRGDVLATNVALALRGIPTLDELEASFGGGASAAQSAYALAYSAVMNLALMDPRRGLTLLFQYWRETRSLERAIRQAYGMTMPEYETAWRRRARWQYGGLAVAANVTLGSLVMLLVLTPLYMARRRRDRQKLEKMKEADAAAERAEQTAIDELLGGP